MGAGRPAVTSREAKAEGRTPSHIRPCSLDRHPLRVTQRHPLGDASQGDGLWQWNDLLAAPQGMAGCWSLAALASSVLGEAGASRRDRLEPCGCGLRHSGGKKRGEKTGPNPTDKGKPGSKHHLLVDRKGVPLTVLLTAANVHDSKVLDDLLDSVPSIPGPRGRPRFRPDKLHADKGYDFPRCRRSCRKRGIRPRIARRGIEPKDRLGRHRWVVERTHAWRAKFRRLRIRDERREDVHLAFLNLGCALICWNFVQRFC
jgi:transposase